MSNDENYIDEKLLDTETDLIDKFWVDKKKKWLEIILGKLKYNVIALKLIDNWNWLDWKNIDRNDYVLAGKV